MWLSGTPARSQINGWTLIEMIIVMVVISLLSAVVLPLSARWYQTALTVSERAHWRAQGEAVLLHLRMQLAMSVPNSHWVSAAGDTLEFFTQRPDSPILAARYRHQPFAPYDRLQLGADQSFDIFTDQSLQLSSLFVSINTQSADELRSDWQQLQQGVHRGSIAAVSQIMSSDRSAENNSPTASVRLTADHHFSNHSPQFIAYFSSGPVGIRCNVAEHQLQLYVGYVDVGYRDFAARTIDTMPARLADSILACRFVRVPAQDHQPAQIQLQLKIGQGERFITVQDSIPLENQP